MREQIETNMFVVENFWGLTWFYISIDNQFHRSDTYNQCKSYGWLKTGKLAIIGTHFHIKLFLMFVKISWTQKYW